jgi:N-acetylglucosaminyl-diphospho-decaprenol L-rhamnosyltransferase
VGVTEGQTTTTAAVVVNFNGGAALADCVASLRREAVREIVVVDNGSTDDSLELLLTADPAVAVVQPAGNLGYGGGVNFGATTVGGDLLLACNADIVLEPGTVAALSRRLAADRSLAVVGPRLVAPDGSVRRSGGVFPTIRRSGLQAAFGVLRPDGAISLRHRAANVASGEGGVVDWVTGACMLFRRDAFDAIGGFDPGYFMYVEEVDLCWRFSRAGWRTGYEPSARVVHLGGVSSAGRPYRMIVAHHRSLWRYARRTTSGAARLGLPLVGTGIAIRGIAVSIRRAVRGSDRSRRDGPFPSAPRP